MLKKIMALGSLCLALLTGSLSAQTKGEPDTTSSAVAEMIDSAGTAEDDGNGFYFSRLYDGLNVQWRKNQTSPLVFEDGIFNNMAFKFGLLNASYSAAPTAISVPLSSNRGPFREPENRMNSIELILGGEITIGRDNLYFGPMGGVSINRGIYNFNNKNSEKSNPYLWGFTMGAGGKIGKVNLSATANMLMNGKRDLAQLNILTDIDFSEAGSGRRTNHLTTGVGSYLRPDLGSPQNNLYLPFGNRESRLYTEYEASLTSPRNIDLTALARAHFGWRRDSAMVTQRAPRIGDTFNSNAGGSIGVFLSLKDAYAFAAKLGVVATYDSRDKFTVGIEVRKPILRNDRKKPQGIKLRGKRPSTSAEQG